MPRDLEIYNPNGFLGMGEGKKFERDIDITQNT
jgi:hypothetical protein